MQKISLIYCCLFFTLLSNGQTNFDWYPFKPNTYYNYTVDSSANPIAAVIKIDSTSAGTPFFYHLNKIVTNCDTCHNALLANDTYDSTYVLNNQAQFAGHGFVKLSNSSFYFKGSKSFVLFPHAGIGTSWIFDSLQNISAAIVLKNIQTIFGQSDSVSYIKRSTQDTLILSKSHGIIQFPIKTISTHKIKLVGIESSTASGIRLKRFHDFFNFNPGDIFQYAFTEEDYNILPPLFKYGNERWDILSVNNYPDSICCSIKKTYFDSVKYGGSIPSITAYTQTVALTFIDSIQHVANLYPQQEILVNPYFLFNNGIKHIHKIRLGLTASNRLTKTFGQICPYQFLSNGVSGAAMQTAFPNVFLNKNSVKLVGREVTEGLGFTSELYNDYDKIYQRCLIGYKKGSEISGTIYESNPVYIKTNLSQDVFFVYPNPVTDKIMIRGTFNTETVLSLINSFGEQISFQSVTPHNNLYYLDTQQFANGLYFIVISNPNFREIKKIIIQHNQ